MIVVDERAARPRGVTMGSTHRTRFGRLSVGAKVGVGMAVAAGVLGVSVEEWLRYAQASPD